MTFLRFLRRTGIAILITIAAIPIVSKALEVRALHRSASSLRCLMNMTAIAGNLEGGGPFCPVSSRPYLISYLGEAQLVSCDDPDQHLRIPIHLVRKGAFTNTRMSLPGFAAAPGRHSLSTTDLSVALRILPSEVRISIKRKPWERFLLMPLAALAGLILFLITSHFAIDSSRETRLILAKARRVVEWGGIALKGLGRLGLWTVGMAAGIVLLGAGLRGSVYSREITIHREKGTAALQDLYFGKAWTEPELVEDVQAVVPVPFEAENYRLHIILAADGVVGRRYLFTVGHDEVGLTELLNRPPVFGP